MQTLDLIARGLSQPAGPDAYGNHWQYNSQSDRHSKVACWATAFALLERSSLLRRHVEDGTVVFGVNHKMSDFKQDRDKRLDLVIARPADAVPANAPTLASLAEAWDVPLNAAERQQVAALPVARVAPVGSVLVALEAKACMTAHVKALPRLYDELNSSHLTVHGASAQALAVGLTMVNAATTFVSPVLNRHPLGRDGTVVTTHRQPHALQRTLDKLAKVPRRSGPGEAGYDAFGVVVIDMANDGSDVRIVRTPPAPAPGDIFEFDQMVNRVVHGYEVQFARI